MEVQIGNSYYYKEDGVWYNEHGEEATRFEVIRIKIMTVLSMFLFIGIAGVMILACVNNAEEQEKKYGHNSEDSILFHYGTPEDVAVKNCETYTFYEYVDPNIVMSCDSRILNSPELRVISEPEMFDVTLTTANYYLEQGKLKEGNENCTHHEFIGEGGKVTYEPNDTCLR